MIKICLCFKIHIPAIHSNYRFFNINARHQYYDDNQLRNHTLQVYSRNLLPFLETIKNISTSGRGNFKAAISISGITLALFKRFVPQAIDLLNELIQKSNIEFLSETWSNSILSHVSNRLMIRQILLHDAQMKSMFGVVPKVFITHSPLSSPELVKTIFDCGKKTVLTYSNHGHQLKSLKKDFSENKHGIERQVFLINYKASKVLQEIDLNLKMKSIDNLSSVIVKKMERNLSVSLPQTVIFNPGDIQKPSTPADSMIWKLTISGLLSDHKISFMLPSEFKNGKPEILNNNLIKGAGSCFKHPDFWLKNSLQKDAFKRQSAINNIIASTNNKSIIAEWDVMHDREYLYYMDNRFFKTEFAEAHYNPYSGPYMAYTNYMNILDDFAGRVTKPKKYSFNKPSVQKTKEKYE